MVNVMVSLIGDQPAPNLFLIQDKAFEHIDRHIFITTAQMEALNRVTHLVQAIGLAEEQYQKIVVQADNLGDLTIKLEALELDLHATVYHVNITSGTKVMSIGAYAYFSQPRFDAKIYYIPVRQDYYWQIYPIEERQELPLQPVTTINTYLSSYGLKELPAQFTPIMRSFEYLAQLLGHYMDDAQLVGFKDKAYRIRTLYNQKQKKPIDLTKAKDIAAFLNAINFPVSQEGQLSAVEAQFLIGGWFEIYIHDLIQKSLELDESSITLQAQIKGLEKKVMASTSEFDVLFWYQRTLHIVECKAGLGGKYPKLRKQLDPALYRLTALKKAFGMNVKVALVTLSPYLRDDDGSFIGTILKRSDDINVQIIDQKMLLRSPSEWLPILLDEK